MDDALPVIFILFIISLIGGCVTDAVKGERTPLQAVTIVSKVYVPESTSFSMDEDGMIEVDTDPEEFWLHLSSGDKVSVSKTVYGTYSVADEVYVSHWLGHWTGIRYSTTVHGRTNERLER